MPAEAYCYDNGKQELLSVSIVEPRSFSVLNLADEARILFFIHCQYRDDGALVVAIPGANVRGYSKISNQLRPVSQILRGGHFITRLGLGENITLSSKNSDGVALKIRQTPAQNFKYN